MTCICHGQFSGAQWWSGTWSSVQSIGTLCAYCLYFVTDKFLFYRVMPVTAHLMTSNYMSTVLLFPLVCEAFCGLDMCQYLFQSHLLHWLTFNVFFWILQACNQVSFLYCSGNDSFKLSSACLNWMYFSIRTLIRPRSFIIKRNLWRTYYFLQCHVPVTHSSSISKLYAGYDYHFITTSWLVSLLGDVRAVVFSAGLCRNPGNEIVYISRKTACLTFTSRYLFFMYKAISYGKIVLSTALHISSSKSPNIFCQNFVFASNRPIKYFRVEAQ
jgi:hypothetical protein